MPKRTLQQVIDAAKAGIPIPADECRDAMLALHSMLAYSRMILEVIADRACTPKNLYITTNALISADQVRLERERWMNTVPADYLAEIEATQKKLDSYRRG